MGPSQSNAQDAAEVHRLLCRAELRKGAWRLVYSVKVWVNHHGISAFPCTSVPVQLAASPARRGTLHPWLLLKRLEPG